MKTFRKRRAENDVAYLVHSGRIIRKKVSKVNFL